MGSSHRSLAQPVTATTTSTVSTFFLPLAFGGPVACLSRGYGHQAALGAQPAQLPASPASLSRHTRMAWFGGRLQPGASS